MRGVTKSRQEPLELFFISTHTPHARRDALCSAAGSNPALFQLTRLMRGVTEKCYSFRGAKKFQLTRLMRGVTSSVEVSTFDIMSFQLTRLMRGVTTHNAEL